MQAMDGRLVVWVDEEWQRDNVNLVLKMQKNHCPARRNDVNLVLQMQKVSERGSEKNFAIAIGFRENAEKDEANIWLEESCKMEESSEC
jgi:hypothetical protein